MNFLEKQQTLRKIQEANPGLVGLVTEEEIQEIFEKLEAGADIEDIVGSAEKATLRAAATVEKEEETAAVKAERAAKVAEVIGEDDDEEEEVVEEIKEEVKETEVVDSADEVVESSDEVVEEEPAKEEVVEEGKVE